MAGTALSRGVIELDRSPPFQRARELMARAEAEIRLIDRAQPLNAAAEREALIAAWGANKPRAPAFTYGAPASFTELRAALEETAHSLDQYGKLGALYIERLLELECEAGVAEDVGREWFVDSAARRYPRAVTPDAAIAHEVAARWLGTTDRRSTTLHKSDNRSDPESLVCALEHATEGMPIRVEIRPNQAAVAAVGDGFIGVRPGLWHTEREVRRIVLHEVEGHARPRVAAQREPLGIFRVGTALSSDDEEGRALLIERRAGLLEGARRRELARRHIAAESVRAGASFVGTVTDLVSRGQDIASAVEAACRAFRGGGLGRELVYLVALTRVTRAFGTEPELETWFERGRVSVAAAKACAAGLES